MGNNMKKILFVCAENAGRSQMAEAFFNRYAQEKGLNWIAESYGTIPAKEVNPRIIEAMREKGIDLISAKPRRFVPEKIREYERVVSFGCLVKTAFNPDVQKRIEEWHIDDPSDKSLEEIKKIRDDVENKVVNLIKSL